MQGPAILTVPTVPISEQSFQSLVWYSQVCDNRADEKGECHMNAEDPQRTSLKQRATKEPVFAAASLAPAQVERHPCHP
jgi:hypothetical protein